MILEKYITREQAQQLQYLCKKKGVKLPESEYIWQRKVFIDILNRPFEWRLVKNNRINKKFDWCHAHDGHELGKILHDQITETHPCAAGWEVHRNKDLRGRESIYSSSETEPKVRCAMLLYLVENNMYS